MVLSTSRGLWLALCLASVALATAFAAYYQFSPSIIRGADAWGYVFYALSFRAEAPLLDFGGLRTYGYPLFLYLISFSSGTNLAGLALAVAIVQYGLFILALGWLVRELRAVSERLAVAVFIGFAVNPVVISSVTDVLTEGLSMVAFVAMAASILTASRLRSAGFILIVFGTFISAAAIMVRPGNIVFGLAWFVAVLVYLYRIYQAQNSFAAVFASFIVALGGVTAVLVIFGPQMIYNSRNFGILSFMPACDLGDFQIYTSVFVARYETLVLPGDQAAGLYYRNPFVSSIVSADSPLDWYFSNTIAGISTLSVHVFNLFNVTSLFTYIRDEQPTYEPLLRAFYWIVVAGGFVTLFALGARNFRDLRLILTSAPRMYVGLGFLGAVALGSITAVEQRFGIVPLAIVSAAFVYGLAGLKPGKEAWTTCFGVIVVAAIGLGVSLHLDSYASRGLDGLGYSFIMSDNCRMTLEPRTWPEIHELFDDMTGAS